MADDSSLFKKFGKAFVPEKFMGKPIRSQLRFYLSKAGFQEIPYNFFGVLFFVSAFITYFVFFLFILPLLQGLPLLIFFFSSFFTWLVLQSFIVAVIIFSIIFYLNISIYNRTKEIESKITDFLVLVSTNLKGGLSLEQSLWASIRPEFGLLAEEMTIASKRVMTGDDLTDALLLFIKKYDSPILKRNFMLIVGEIKSGGKIVQVIDKVIVSLKRTKSLKEEMASSTVSYMIFIGVIVLVVAPVLFALAFQLLDVILSFTSQLGSSLDSSALGFSLDFSEDSFETSHFRIFSILSLFVIGFFSSLIVSIIEKGDMKGGLKYIPVFTVVSIIMYLVASTILNNLFGGMI